MVCSGGVPRGNGGEHVHWMQTDETRPRPRQRLARVVGIAVVVFVSGLISSAAGAAPATLDPSFGTGGKVSADLGGGASAVLAIPQTNGKIVVVGSGTLAPLQQRWRAGRELRQRRQAIARRQHRTPWPSRQTEGSSRLDRLLRGLLREFALARHNLDGSLDASFDGDGSLTTDFSALDEASGVVIQADGKIVAEAVHTAPSGVGSHSPVTTLTEAWTRASAAAGSRDHELWGVADRASGVAFRPTARSSQRVQEVGLLTFGAPRPLQQRRQPGHELR